MEKGRNIGKTVVTYYKFQPKDKLGPIRLVYIIHTKWGSNFQGGGEWIHVFDVSGHKWHIGARQHGQVEDAGNTTNMGFVGVVAEI